MSILVMIYAGIQPAATASQFAYPTADVLSNGWDSAPTAAQPLFEQIDELTTPSDTDYVFTQI